jgi:uncharacterized membrane-anchored protein YhcB (DUF1043 family)
MLSLSDYIQLERILPTPAHIRQITRDYHIEMTAHNTEQIASYQAKIYKQQAAIAQETISVLGESNLHLETLTKQGQEIIQGLVRLNQSIDSMRDGIHRLNTTAEMTLQAIDNLTSMLQQHLNHISQQLLHQQQNLQRISDQLASPYEMQARELRREAMKWLRQGASSLGRDRQGHWNDALGLFQQTLDNPIGKQDHVACFEYGWLLWKHKGDLVGAEEAFDRARRLSTTSKDLYHEKSCRHLAYMQYLDHRCEDAFQTMETIVPRMHMVTKTHYDILFDTAR